MRKMRARKAKGRQAHLGACTMPRVTPEEHPAREHGGGGATITVLATRASSSESKEVLVWLQRYR